MKCSHCGQFIDDAPTVRKIPLLPSPDAARRLFSPSPVKKLESGLHRAVDAYNRSPSPTARDAVMAIAAALRSARQREVKQSS